MERYEVLIVGASVGGLSTGLHLLKRGVKFLIVDSKKKVGEPIQCAEFIPKATLLNFSQHLKKSIRQEVKLMRHFIEGYAKELTCPSEGFVIDRKEFERSMAKELRESLRLSKKYLYSEGEVHYLLDLKTKRVERVRANLLIGADGPRSRVRGEPLSYYMVSAQMTFPLKEKVKELLVFFRKYIVGGYGWVFPKGEVANVGVGIDPSFGENLQRVFRRFLLEVEPLIERGKVLSRTGGIIPSQKPFFGFKNNRFLVGDACALAHPITGGGIYQSLLSGKWVAENLENPKEYKEVLYENFYDYIDEGFKGRLYLRQNWKGEELVKLVLRTWRPLRGFG